MTEAPQFDHEHILSMIEQLARRVPHEKAYIKLQHWHPDSCLCIGNRAGYLRLGIELLKVAYVPTEDTDITFMGTLYAP
ncbi:MAG: hypothetical protein ACJ8CR_20110, partial [Roseiflexaceae bacterium]